MRRQDMLHNVVIVDALNLIGSDGLSYCIDGHVDLWATTVPFTALSGGIGKAETRDSWLDTIYAADPISGDYMRIEDINAFITKHPGIYADLVKQMDAEILKNAERYLTGANLLSGDL